MVRIIHDVAFMMIGLYLAVVGAAEHSVVAIACGFVCIIIARVGEPEYRR